MPIELFDTHTHLTDTAFDADREEVISRALTNGVTRMVTIGIGPEAKGAYEAVALAEKYDCIWASIGIHPHDATSDIKFLDDLKQLSKHAKVVAIGETGLDFYRDWSPVELQEKWFRLQIELALDIKKPLIIHSREAGEQCFNILKEMKASDVGGVFHCFSETTEFANRLADINFIISIPGTVTFKKAENVKAVVKDIPIERIMLETDAPYIAPVPFRGKRCESAFMLETAKVVADIKGVSLEEVAMITTNTAKNFFNTK
jgi:TatD DNase family protein